MSSIFGRAIIAVVATLAFVGGGRDAGAAFDVNLLTNPGAESGTFVGIVGGFSVFTTPGWTNVSGNFEAELYSEGVPPNINPSSPGPVDRGSLLFYGGNAPVTVATQAVSVADVASTIDAGQAITNLSGWLGGFANQDDNTIFTVTYLGASNNFLGASAIGPVLAAARGNVSGLVFRSLVEFVPVGTRTISATLVMTRTEGTFNNAAADNLNLTLRAIPEPSSLLMCGLSAAIGLARLARLRRVGR